MEYAETTVCCRVHAPYYLLLRASDLRSRADPTLDLLNSTAGTSTLNNAVETHPTGLCRGEMTIFIPLDASAPLPPSPHFLIPSAEPTAHVRKVIKTILKSKRIAVLCGAGISVNAGIPDFRSETGLFQTLKKDHSSLSSGKDLFDASVFNSEATTALFCKMIAGLAELAQVAQPTPFHHMLRALDDKGKLLRVYTQNIDALELKAGLTFGVPELDVKRTKPRSKGSSSDSEALKPDSSLNATDRLPTPPAETPRCIPLHGTLQSMHCQICLHSFPLEQYLGHLNAGAFPICPDCSRTEETRQAVGKRSRGIGKLRPSVVLYNEMHKDGEEVGNVVTKDVVGGSKGKGRTGADLLIVVGTSLRVPGTKRMVRGFSKAIRSRSAVNSQSDSSVAGPSSAPEDDPPVKTIYLNLDFPVPMREWQGVFDVWLRGDAQTFAKLVLEEVAEQEQALEARLERKRRREETKAESADAQQNEGPRAPSTQTASKPSSKNKTKPNSTKKPSSAAGQTQKRKPAGGDTQSIKRRKLNTETHGVLPVTARRDHPPKFPLRIPPRPYPTTPPSHRQHARSHSPRAVNEEFSSSLSSPLSTPPESSPATPALCQSISPRCSSPLTELPSSPVGLYTPPSIVLHPSRSPVIPTKLELTVPESQPREPFTCDMISQPPSPPPTPMARLSPLSPSVRRRRPTVSQPERSTLLSHTSPPSEDNDDIVSLDGHFQHRESYARAVS
ncbi:DHS-like NAD/FAD-binding domain-containing protein [Trametopsis cervina]|nr:DHS-like NAD/FAD-binding domain-containing protein [Trametopsis cervina]